MQRRTGRRRRRPSARGSIDGLAVPVTGHRATLLNGRASRRTKDLADGEAPQALRDEARGAQAGMAATLEREGLGSVTRDDAVP